MYTILRVCWLEDVNQKMTSRTCTLLVPQSQGCLLKFSTQATSQSCNACLRCLNACKSDEMPSSYLSTITQTQSFEAPVSLQGKAHAGVKLHIVKSQFFQLALASYQELLKRCECNDD